MLTLLGVIASTIIFILLGTYTNKNQRSKIMAIVTGVMLVSAVGFVVFAIQNDFNDIYEYMPYVAQFGFGFFVTLMFAKPVHLILKNKPTMHLMQARRELGITTWLLFVPHALVNAVNFLGQGNFALPILGGVLVITLMTIIVFTSFNWTKSFIPNKWFKMIQNLAYIAFFIALVHAFIMTATYVYLGIAITYLAFRIFVYIVYENKKRKWIYATIFTIAALLSISSAVVVSVDNSDMVPQPFFDDSGSESNSLDDDTTKDANDGNGGTDNSNASNDSDTNDDNGGATNDNGTDASSSASDDNGTNDVNDDNGGATGGNGTDDSPDTYDDNGGNTSSGSDDSPDTYDDNGGY